MKQIFNVVLSMVPTSTGNLQNTLGFHHRNFGKIPQDIVCLRAIMKQIFNAGTVKLLFETLVKCGSI